MRPKLIVRPPAVSHSWRLKSSAPPSDITDCRTQPESASEPAMAATAITPPLLGELLEKGPNNQGDDEETRKRKKEDTPNSHFRDHSVTLRKEPDPCSQKAAFQKRFCGPSYSFLNISSATCSLPLGTRIRKATSSPQSRISPSGRMRVGSPSPSRTSFHISAVIRFGTFLNSVHILAVGFQPSVISLC